ncbi:MAG: hypothetical protein E6R07_02460 [Nevskiaceae bacterium]|nr:MAG: hypothetical protein E6R07_02460 [Nevskiaceae bacterium]
MNQQEGPDQDDFAQSLRKLLRSSESVDRRTARRLAQARARAIVAAQPASTFHWLVPAGAVAAAIAMVLSLRHAVPTSQPAPELQAADALDLLTDDKDPQFYRDLEFYKWLEKHQRHA